MSNRSPELLIEDMLVSAAKIKRYTSGMSFEQFETDEKTVDAVIRNVILRSSAKPQGV